MDMTERAAWGILGTGGIAHIFAAAVGASSSGRLAAVGSRDASTAAAFAGEFGIDRSHGSYQAVLDDPAVEFVYIATPHTLHVELAVAAARAGKHILCEKPIAPSAAGAAIVIEAARAAGVFLMEGFAFRCHPQTKRLAELLEGDEIGELRSINAQFGFDAGPAPTNYLFRHDLAGGAMLDNGCYPVSLSRRIAGHTVGATYRDPDRLTGAGLLHPEQAIDLDAHALSWYEGGIAAHLTCTLRTEVDKNVLITGSRGFIRLPAAFLPGRMDRFGGQPRIILERDGEAAREIVIDAPAGLYTIEADTVVARAREGRTEAPEMTWEDSMGNMRVLDRWRAEVGVHYDEGVETPTIQTAV
jgi:predicted dehydrogenase